METDVYAFGCLYYAVSLSIDPSARITRPVQIFFNFVPYAGQLPHRIFFLVTSAIHPPLLEDPKMRGSLWKLINDCWKFRASERPTMEHVVATIKSYRKLPFPSALVTALDEVCTGFLGIDMRSLIT